MSDIESNKEYHGIISDFTINEMIKVIRSILVTRKITNASSWENKIKWALDKIYSLNKNNFTVVSDMAYENNSDNDMNFGTITAEATQLMKEKPGKIKTDTKGRITHMGLSTADTVHATLAKWMNCSKIATFDNGFNEISDYLPRMNIKEEYPI